MFIDQLLSIDIYEQHQEFEELNRPKNDLLRQPFLVDTNWQPKFLMEFDSFTDLSIDVILTDLHHSFESFSCVPREPSANVNYMDLRLDKNYFQYRPVVRDDAEDNSLLFLDSNEQVDDDSNDNIDHYRIEDFRT